MADCRYCTWCGHAEPPDGSASWEPLDWICEAGWTVREGWHECRDYEREVGSDDDLGEDDD